MTVDRELSDAEVARVAAVNRYDAIGKPPEEDLQSIARLAARIAGVESAAVNLIDDRFQHQIAAVGFDASSQPRVESMCNTSIGCDHSVYVPDAAGDPRFADNPWVSGRLGSLRFYDASLLRSPDGYVIGTLCVFDDHARTLDEQQREALDDLADQVVAWLELRQRQARLETTVGELERSNADLASFAGRIAHDLRNPLTALVGFLTLAERRFGDEMSGPLATIVHTALASANRMTRLIEDMLAFATVGAEPVLTEVDLLEVADAVATDSAIALAGAGAILDVQPLPRVVTDATLVRALLSNLVGNAVKFTREGVPPVITVAGGFRDEGGWWVSVADNGRGVPEAERSRIFEPFARASNSVGAQGNGIGLATCVKIADRLSGRLDVAESPQGGATFTLTVT